MSLSIRLDIALGLLEARRHRADLEQLKKIIYPPHVNPKTNELWNRMDKNWPEARAAGEAWTIEEIVKAMMPYINKIAWEHGRGRRISDDLRQELILWFLTNVLGKNEKTGEWHYQTGRSPT